METQNRDRNLRIYSLGAVITLVQLFDIVIHVANDMIEPIRMAASVIIFVWLSIVLSGRLNHIPWRVASGFVGVYVLLNALFLATEGLTNPDNGDQFRTVLFVLVGVTVTLSVWLANSISTSFWKAMKKRPATPPLWRFLRWKAAIVHSTTRVALVQNPLKVSAIQPLVHPIWSP